MVGSRHNQKRVKTCECLDALAFVMATEHCSLRRSLGPMAVMKYGYFALMMAVSGVGTGCPCSGQEVLQWLSYDEALNSGFAMEAITMMSNSYLEFDVDKKSSLGNLLSKFCKHKGA